jgi:hypothetical protein
MHGHGVAGERSETPVDEYNHALAALRYLVSRIDERKQARTLALDADPPAPQPRPPQVVRFRPFCDMWRDAEVWTSF